MQNTGQYGGVSDAPQYVVGRQAAPAHIFSISHDSMSIAAPGAHALHHHHHHHLQQQQQAQHHYGHPSLQQIQQHPQFSQLQDAHQHQHQQREREREQQQQQQQAMVQQLGLGGGPESPEVPSPGVSRPSPTKFGGEQQQQKQQLVVGGEAAVAAAAAAAAQEDDGMEDEGRSAGGNRWPRQETLALIKIRSEMDSTFRDSGLKGPLWEEVSRKLAEQGYSRTAKKCKEKFENVHKYYKKTKDGKAGRQDGKSYRFFSQLEALYCGQEAAMQLGSRLAASAAASLLTDSAAAAAAVLTGSATPASKVDNGMIQQQQQQQRQSEVTLSESMSEDEEDYDEEPSSKKRKRGEGVKEDAHFFSTLMKNLVEKQESMQHKFLEFMERREQERQALDESWRRQELARVAREHELRVQEQQLAATRDAALVAFLQKVTGQTLSLPQIPPPPLPAAIDSTPKTQHTPTPPASHQLVTLPDAVDDSPIDPNSKRWPKPEVLTLIKLRSDMEPRFQEPGPKAPLWEEISQGMACLGYNRNQKRCKEKWENINKYFRKTKESNKKRPENAKTCPYFHQLELLYMKGVLGTPHNKKLPALVDSEKVDHQAVPLAQRTEVAATTPPSSEMALKMLPAAAEAVLTTAPANSGNGSGQLFSSPENGSSGAKAHVPETST